MNSTKQTREARQQHRLSVVLVVWLVVGIVNIVLDIVTGDYSHLVVIGACMLAVSIAAHIAIRRNR